MIHKNLQVMIILAALLVFPQGSLWGQSNAQESFENKDYDAAIQAWDELLLEHPELKGINYNKGNALFRKGEMDKAISSFEQALGEQDEDALADIYYNMGNAWLSKQDIKKAREFYKQTLKLRPDDLDAKTNLELLNHLPPPPPQDQNSEQNQEKQESEDQQQEQNSDSQQKNEEQQEQEQDESQGDQKEQQQDQNEEQDQNSEEQEQNPSFGEEQSDPEELRNALQLLEALKDRETENMREQIKLKTSGADQEKDW